MLNALTIKNVALIKSLTVNFSEGLNILSGETGAGKSIIIDSLGFVLGGKADKTMIRSGEDGCEVSALFEIGESFYPKLDEMGLERDDCVLIKRTLDVSGKGKCFVNGQVVPVSMLKGLTSGLCDIHGQSEHHSLMKVSSHMELLDKFGGDVIAQPAEAVRSDYRVYREIKKELASFGGNSEDRERRIDILKFQIDEIDDAELIQGELSDLIAERKRVMNLEKLISALSTASELLGGMNCSATDTVSSALSELDGAADYDARVSEQAERLRSLKYELDDISSEVSDILAGYDGDDAGEANLNRIEDRIERIKQIHKKYGATFEDVLRFYERAQTELDKLTKSDKLIAELTARLENALEKLLESSIVLGQARRETAGRLETAIMEQMKDLGLKNAVFRVSFNDLPNAETIERDASAIGTDETEFYMSANLGQPLKPLVKVISGGETSRFMLAVKTITSDIDAISLMVFDEIDTGISGEIAQMVAKKFAVISKTHQLIAITHLPQIAAMGDSNYLIEKRDEDGETLTYVGKLGTAEKEREIARLAGGSNIGEHGVLHARELIDWCTKFKTE